MTLTPRDLPAIDRLLASPGIEALCHEFSRIETANALRGELTRIRDAVRGGAGVPASMLGEPLVAAVRARVLALRLPGLRRCVNATGIVLHTNLGRAPLAPAAVEAVARTAGTYSNLEFDLEPGQRGSRGAHVEAMLRNITGAEAACVVNNCAAAVMLVLRAVGGGGGIVASRGELIEIGGSFRMPDVIAQSAGRLIEVGTTNKTRLADYAEALAEPDRTVLLSHRSNFEIVGFTSRPTVADVVKTAHERGAIVVEDIGSGSLIDLSAWGLGQEPTVAHSLAAGVDIVTFSGDKLLGGPQAGIILGRAPLIARIRSHPLARAVRLDKLSLAALEATLRLYLPPHDPVREIPVLRMLTAGADEIGRRAGALARRLRRDPRLQVRVVDGTSYAGGGTLPMCALPSRILSVTHAGIAPAEFARRLRSYVPAVIVRTGDGATLMDPRTLLPGEDRVVEAALRATAA